MHIMTGLLGAAVGMAIAAVIWAVVVSLRKKRSGDAPQFDERQLAARAKAYSSAFFTLLGYLAVVALLDSVAEVRWAARSTRSSGRRQIREQPPLPLKSARKFAKISPLRCKKPDVSDIRLFALFQSRSRDAAAVPMAEAFGTGLHTQ